MRNSRTRNPVPEPPGGPPPGSASQELHAALCRAVEALDPDLRGVFLLRDVERRSTAETARRLLTSVSTIKLRLHRARKEICRQVWQYFQAAAPVEGEGQPAISRERATPVRLVRQKTRNTRRASGTLRGRAA
jgi:hypothetical protein